MLQRARILLADGNEDDVVLIRSALRELGLERKLIVADSGDQAIRYLAGEGKYGDRTAYPLPLMVMTDLKLLKSSGFEVLEWIQDHPEVSRFITTIVLTSDERLQSLEQAYALGANSYLIKPPKYNDLVELMRQLKEYWLETNRRPSRQ